MNTNKLNEKSDYLFKSAIARAFNIQISDVEKNVKEINGHTIIHEDGRKFFTKVIQIKELKFEGIDDWNRAVFKDKYNYRYGNVDILFDYSDTFEIVSEKLSEKHIEYFGRTFNCEPMGTSIDTNLIELVKEFSNFDDKA